MATPSQLPSNGTKDVLSALPQRPLGGGEPDDAPALEPAHDSNPAHRASRPVVPGLPRAKTFKRQQSEDRGKLEELRPTQAELRAVSADRRAHPVGDSSHPDQQAPRAIAPADEKQTMALPDPADASSSPGPGPAPEDAPPDAKYPHLPPFDPTRPVSAFNCDPVVRDELDWRWILNLSMHFRDKSKREKFFVSYQQKKNTWRRVTVSLDYRDCPPYSLEEDIFRTEFQRDKNVKIYDAIRVTLEGMYLFDTVTNLKLETKDGHLHIGVVEDISEIINYPTYSMVRHMRCPRYHERDVEFVSHMSGYVYQVRVHGQLRVKKEVPGPDHVDEFLYELNALSALGFSEGVIDFHGVVVDKRDNIKALLVDYAPRGTLWENLCQARERGLAIPWPQRLTWARQLVHGVADLHECGFVQGDLTLSNVVVDGAGGARLIDVNRRGCPVGWEPPEVLPLVRCGQRFGLYVGPKSDLYQLGAVLWALATLDEEPESAPKPLRLDGAGHDDAVAGIPNWYRTLLGVCLHPNPRFRLAATSLIGMFPEPLYEGEPVPPVPPVSISIDGVPEMAPNIRTVSPGPGWCPYPALDAGAAAMGPGARAVSPAYSDDSFYFPPRGRSPPSPLPSDYERREASYFPFAAGGRDVGSEDDGGGSSAVTSRSSSRSPPRVKSQERTSGGVGGVGVGVGGGGSEGGGIPARDDGVPSLGASGPMAAGGKRDAATLL